MNGSMLSPGDFTEKRSGKSLAPFSTWDSPERNSSMSALLRIIHTTMVAELARAAQTRRPVRRRGSLAGTLTSNATQRNGKNRVLKFAQTGETANGTQL